MGREILGGPDAGKQIVRPLTGLPQTINRNSSVDDHSFEGTRAWGSKIRRRACKMIVAARGRRYFPLAMNCIWKK